MHTKNINHHQLETHHNPTYQHLSTTPLHSLQTPQVTLSSHGNTFPPSEINETLTSMADSRYGSFQKKFRSVWFGSKRWKRQEISSLSKSLSTPNITSQEVSCRDATSYPSSSTMFQGSCCTLPASLRHRPANIQQSDAVGNVSHLSPSVPDLSKTLRNYKLALQEKLTTKEIIEQTQPKNIAPLETAIDDQFVVVVSDLESARKYLREKSEEISETRESTNQLQAPEAQSSSASESGRGTCSSETKQDHILPPVNACSSGKKERAEYLKSKYPQLYLPATRAPMPIVAESESWVSDSSCTVEKSNRSKPSYRTEKFADAIKKKASLSEHKSQKVSSNFKSTGHKSRILNDASSIDPLDDDESSVVRGKSSRDTLKSQLKGLQDMYGEILKGIKASPYNRPLMRRKAFGSASTLTSLASRSRRRIPEPSHRRSHHRQHSLDDSNRIKSLENHITTLAQSVTYLSSEIRKSERMFEEIEGIRNEMNRIKQQMNHLCDCFESKARIASSNQGGYESGDKKANKKISKISKLFMDQPTPLRQFLKHLGYEKYSILLEQEKIGLEELCYIPEERLAKLGIAMGPRIRILQEIRQLQQQYNYSSMKRGKTYGQII